jgi:hypothetical protein
MDIHLFERCSVIPDTTHPSLPPSHLFISSHCQQSVVENLFDCIVTDPPYGIRAGAKKTGRY